MALTTEWRGRIDSWRKLLPRFFYQPLADIPMAAHFTFGQYSARAAAALKYVPVKPGFAWGRQWEYAWFKGRVRLPKEAAGHRVVLSLNVGAGENPVNEGWAGESAVYANGVPVGGRDWAHPYQLLVRRAKGGETIDILTESYAGHGETPIGWDAPVLHGEPGVKPCPATQRVVGVSTAGIWREPFYQAWLDFETLVLLRDQLEADSLQLDEIDQALCEFTRRVDLTGPAEAAEQAIPAGRKILAPLLRARNGTITPTMHAIGNSHIDVAWLWPLRETDSKCVRTFSAALGLMEEYPEYRFLQSQAYLYARMKELQPDLYARIRRAARRGQWIPEGAMWVEPDINVTGGESLIRQLLYGKRFFREEFGVDCRLMWLPDVFGFSAALPQILKGCGVDYFSTQKVNWIYNGGEPYPFTTFHWEGIDGTRVGAHFHQDYGLEPKPDGLVRIWRGRFQKTGIAERILPYGYGDGGGGPTRDQLEFIRRAADLQGCPRTKHAHPVAVLDHLAKDADRWPVYVGELYYQAHRGTLTTQAKTKSGNRRSEFALREAEAWTAAAATLAGARPATKALAAGWRNILLNQFHDILPGSSIERVYREAEALYDETIASARREAAVAAGRLARKKTGALTVFNPLSWTRNALVELPKGWNGATDADGRALPAQKHGDAVFARAELPSWGWTTLAKAAPAPAANAVRATRHSLENELLRVVFNQGGEATSVIDKATGRERLAGPANVFRLYRDEPIRADAWDIDPGYTTLPVDVSGPAEITVAATGPLFGALRIAKRIGGSTLVQEVRLEAGRRTLTFATTVEWRERRRLLKVDFPVAVHANEALHEIQFGHLARPNHASRAFDAARFEVAAHKWTGLVEPGRGCAVLNDGKYGVSVLGNTISLSLLRSPIQPDGQADRGTQRFTYAFHCWEGPFAECDLVRAGYELNVGAPLTVAGDGGTRSLLGVDAGNVVVDTAKLAEDGSGDWVVRLYESKGTGAAATLAVGMKASTARETDMLEEGGRPRPLRNGRIPLAFRPFEIKTLRLAFS